MPIEDAFRWDARYKEETRYSHFAEPRPYLAEHLELLPRAGLALDAAMGLGGNAGLLIARGWKVIGVDISGVAVREARRRHPSLLAVQADLTRFYLPPARFDAILNFYYLQRDLWARYLAALKPGGWLVIETLTRDMLSLFPETDPQYLLEAGELLDVFSGHLEIIDYLEGWLQDDRGRPRATARLLGYKVQE